MAEIQGMCGKRFGAVRDALAASLDADDVGACVAVYLGDEPVVDIWGGYTGTDRTAAWQRDTITGVWSITKIMTALCVLMLADRGDLGLTAPVATYWPEFAAAGKDRVEVRHLLSHTAGLPTWDEPMTVEDLYDWPGSTARLAAQAPRWEPGSAAGYHALTHGYLVGEVVRRVTGRSVGAFFADEVAGPLGADFHIGLPAEHDHRFAPVIPPPVTPSGSRDAGRPASGPPNPPIRAADANTLAWRRAGISSAGGYGNARSAGAVQSVLACGGMARGVRLLSAAGCEPARQEQYRGQDTVLGAPMCWGMGYGIWGNFCGWGGWGGSLLMIDFSARLTVAYVMNQMLDEGWLGDNRGLEIVMAAHGAVE